MSNGFTIMGGKKETVVVVVVTLMGKSRNHPVTRVIRFHLLGKRNITSDVR